VNETSKCSAIRGKRGDFDVFLTGDGIDIGCGDDLLVVPHGHVEPWDVAQGDAQLLESCEEAQFDFVYSSHCLEHLVDVREALRNWVRVLRPGGALYFVVPDYALYEKLRWPSKFNPDHKHSFSQHIPRDKVHRDNHWQVGVDVAAVLWQCGIKLIRIELEDYNYDYSAGPSSDQTANPATLAQICVVGRKR
jgi:SAM-dependent methyltransferase